MKEPVNFDCRHFKGHMPCRPHKETGVHCSACSHYDPIDFRILIVKLDAIGDVLRTSAILPGLRGKYPNSHITWITAPASLPLFKGNRLVDRVVDAEKAVGVLLTEEYDLVINLDAAGPSAQLASLAESRKKLGYVLSSAGQVTPVNEEAEHWFLMGIFDDLKKANRETYQQIMFKIIGLRYTGQPMQLELDESEKRFASDFARNHGIGQEDPVIGISTGAGARWEKKKWTEDGFVQLIGRIRKEMPKARILLLGGPDECSRNRRLMLECGQDLIDTGCDNPLREFISLISLCDLVVTGDTLPMHLALALGKKTVVLVGPTSPWELEMYGRGAVVTSDRECICCYLNSCSVQPDCMESIEPDQVLESIKELLGYAGRDS